MLLESIEFAAKMENAIIQVETLADQVGISTSPTRQDPK